MSSKNVNKQMAIVGAILATACVIAAIYFHVHDVNKMALNGFLQPYVKNKYWMGFLAVLMYFVSYKMYNNPNVSGKHEQPRRKLTRTERRRRNRNK